MQIASSIAKAKQVYNLPIDSHIHNRSRIKFIPKMYRGLSCLLWKDSLLGIDLRGIRQSIVRSIHPRKLRLIALWQELVKFW